MKKRSVKERKKSIFQTIFVPLIFVMILQAVIFYVTAVYGGVEQSLNQNASDILTERMTNRKNEIETKFNNDWNNLSSAQGEINSLYEAYQLTHGDTPFVNNPEIQIQFLEASYEFLIKQLRSNQTSGIFLILNDQNRKTTFPENGQDTKYGCGIRDMDPTSVYSNREDLLLERMPSSLVEQTGCSLDSWWEAYYTFDSVESGKYFYNPLNSAWDNRGAESEDIAYFQGSHRIGSTDQEVVSYSIPLIDNEGRPYAVLGIELTTKYMSSLLLNEELGNPDNTCYILATHNVEEDECIPDVAHGALYNRCFHDGMTVNCADKTSTGGFVMTGQDGTTLYGTMDKFEIYNNNNPFEDNELVLIALVEEDTLFSYSQKVKQNLLLVSVISLILGVICIFIVSHSFAYPITSLANEARNVEPKRDFHLPHLGIAEIDQLVDSIEELNKNVSKETARIEFFSRMSHDMRTPMNAIISFSSEEMLEGADEGRKNDYLKKIHTSGEYLLGLINEVLDMTKIESRKVDLNYDDIMANEMLDTVISMVEKLADKKNIEFVRKLDVPENMCIKADPQHLNQILLNLLSNAVKFTREKGKVTLDCKMVLAGKGRVHCTFVVADNGIGMSKSFMDKLYEPFEQENEGNGGTGLGLSISKKLTELMGGQIICVSEKGKGTTFTVELDFDKSAPTEILMAGPIEKPKIFNGDTLRSKRILICEDQPLNVLIAQRLLERVGMIIEVAENGQVGADKFANSQVGYYDCILMDIRMPVLDGLGATRCIREMNRDDAKKIPIIAMTANAFEEDIKKSREAGMNEHLSKPIEPFKLYQTLENFLK